MKWKITAAVGALLIVVIAVAWRFEIGMSPQAKRDRRLEIARSYVAQGKSREAIIEFRNALEIDPGLATVRHELGMALLGSGDIQSAFREFFKAASLQPKMIESHFQMGRIYLAVNDLARAEDQLDKIRDQNEHALEARILAFEIAVANKDADSALKEIQAAIKENPKATNLFVDLANIYRLKGDAKAAEAAFGEALRLNPTLDRARIGLVSLYLDLGQQDKAKEALLSAVKANPGNESLLDVLGLFYSRTSHVDDFEKLYRDLLGTNPNSIIAKKRLAELAIVKGDLKTAQQYLDEIFKVNDDDTEGRFLRARLLLAQKNYKQAGDELALVTQKAPTLASPFYYYGLAQIGSNYHEQARGAFLRAVTLKPFWSQPRLELGRLYLADGNYKLALQESETVLKTEPQNREALDLQTRAYLANRDFERALEVLKKVRQLYPNDAAVHINIGEVYRLQKQPGLALKEFEEAARLDSNRVDALAMIAQIHFDQGNKKAAFDRVQQQMPLAKDPAALYQLLGSLSKAEKDYESAVGYLEKAIALNPNLYSAFMILGEINVAQNRPEKAIELFQKVIDKNPRDISARMLLGTLHDRLNQHEKANVNYKKILEIDERFAAAANNLAWNYAEHGGDIDVALELARKARDANPQNPYFADTLGWIYYRKEIYPTAVSLLKDVSERLGGKDPNVLFHLGQAYYKNGERNAARDALAKALAINPNLPGADEATKVLSKLGQKRDS